jgi:nitrite reductase/ring-hydroxylating ferredoxin subunit
LTEATKVPAGQRIFATFPPPKAHSRACVAFAHSNVQSAAAHRLSAPDGGWDGRSAAYTGGVGSMAEQLVGKVSDFKDGDRRIVFIGDREIGIFRHEGEFHAYSNYCLHQGGPACEGLTMPKVEEKLMPDMTSRGLYFSDTEMHFVCPWHGYEYDMLTGECVADRKLKLRKYKVLQKGEDVYVVA